jgi:HEAT repeat protein
MPPASAPPAELSDKEVAAEVLRILESIRGGRSLKRMAEAAEPTKRLGKRAVPHLLRALKEAKNERTRLAAIFGLGPLGPDAREAAPDLFRIAKQKWGSFTLRAAAMGGLREIRPKWADHLPFLADALSDPALAPQAREVLVELGPAARPLVRDLIKKVEAWGLQAQYAQVLAAIGPGAREAIPLLIEILRKAPSDERGWAAWTLGNIGPQTREVMPALLRALKREHPDVRQAAAAALTYIPQAEEVVPALLEALREDPWVRETALRGLGLMGKKAEKALPDILKIAANPRTDLELDTAVEALGNIGVARPEVVRAVRAALKGSRCQTRVAVKALWQLSAMSDEDVRQLAGVVEDIEMGSLTRGEAIELLGKMGPKARSAVPALLKALKDREPFVRETAAESLKQIDPKAARKAGIKSD